jgi:cyclic pyranopterin phosphate synthase
MERLMTVFSDLGITKLRITGGEPFVRKGIMDFLGRMASLEKLEDIHITTNGTFTKQFVPRLIKMGIKSINLSLDTLDAERFFAITRRDKFEQVMSTYHTLLSSDFQVKINMVVINGKNIDDIIPMINLTKDQNVNVRFIEEMPFNGTAGQGNSDFWPIDRILKYIESNYSIVEKIADPKFSTSVNYRIKGHVGTFGIIAAYTRSFCGSCNRIRITPQGDLKTCLYGPPKLSVRDLMRSGLSDEELSVELTAVLQQRAIDGFEAEKELGSTVHDSMATIGG